MNNSLKRLIQAGAVAVAGLGAIPAFAAGTDTNAGTIITNDVTVDYQVGGVAQTQINPTNQPTARNQITVDRKVVLTVAQVGSATTNVSPGQAAAATTFLVTNSTNGTIDIGLTAANLATGTSAVNGGTADAFNGGAFTYYLDDGDGIYNVADTLITYLDQVPEDATRTVHVVTSIPLTATNGQVAVVSLTGEAKDATTAGTQGSVFTVGGANTAGIDTVFADAAGSDDAVTDGKHSARDDYTVQSATLAVQKLARVIEDPVNTIASGNAANAKMIPGATVEYCIAITNTGSVSATNVAINDAIGALPVTYLSAFGVKTGGTFSAGACTAGAGAGSFASGTVSATGLTVGTGAAPANTNTVVFRVTIN